MASNIVTNDRRRRSVVARRGFQRAQVHLDHPHHRFHGFGMTDQRADIARHNLPAQPEAVREPAAGHRLATLDQLVPVAVDLFLGVAADKEREGGIELVRGAAVEKDHLLAPELDRDRGNLACGPGADAFGTQLIELARVREDAQVELGGFFGVVVEPEERRKFIHALHGTSQESLLTGLSLYGNMNSTAALARRLQTTRKSWDRY